MSTLERENDYELGDPLEIDAEAEQVEIHRVTSTEYVAIVWLDGAEDIRLHRLSRSGDEWSVEQSASYEPADDLVSPGHQALGVFPHTRMGVLCFQADTGETRDQGVAVLVDLSDMTFGDEIVLGAQDIGAVHFIGVTPSRGLIVRQWSERDNRNHLTHAVDLSGSTLQVGDEHEALSDSGGRIGRHAFTPSVDGVSVGTEDDVLFGAYESRTGVPVGDRLQIAHFRRSSGEWEQHARDYIGEHDATTGSQSNQNSMGLSRMGPRGFVLMDLNYSDMASGSNNRRVDLATYSWDSGTREFSLEDEETNASRDSASSDDEPIKTSEINHGRVVGWWNAPYVGVLLKKVIPDPPPLNMIVREHHIQATEDTPLAISELAGEVELTDHPISRFDTEPVSGTRAAVVYTDPDTDRTLVATLTREPIIDVPELLVPRKRYWGQPDVGHIEDLMRRESRHG